MQRYFALDDKDILTLRDTDLHHIKNVMRMNVGSLIEVVFNNKLYICSITSFEPFNLKIIETKEDNGKINFDITVAVGLVKEQKFDLILQKLTELGVNRIIPVKMERSIVKVDDSKMTKKLDRWNMICKEASEQAKRTTTPIIENVISIKELAKLNADLKLVASTREKDKDLSYYLQNINTYAKIIIVIGPEGGISSWEEDILIENNYHSVSFGNLIFRVETAAIYVASVLNFYSSLR